MSDLSVGVSFSLLAGILNGSFAAPTKYAKNWKWENIWAVWGIVAMFMCPWILAFATVPSLFPIYHNAINGQLLRLIGFGIGFGLAQIFFGLGVTAVGLSLGFAIAIGLSTAVGSFVPLVVLQSETAFTRKGLTILAGVALVLVGIVVCAVAGGVKDKQMKGTAQLQGGDLSSPRSFGTGLVICILAGLGSPLINFGLAFGAPLLSRAAQLGVSPASRANVIWAPLVTASLVPYLAYCTHLWRKNGSSRLFVLPGTAVNWLLGTIMGLLWMGSFVLYGAASARMASMGPILGWPLFMSVIIVTSNAWGFLTGEWKGVGRQPLGIMLGGIVFLILGFCTLAFAGRLS